MFAAKKPPDVGEEETSLGVVRVGVSFAEFVVDSVISGPVNDGIFESQGVAESQDEAERPFGFVRAMGPKSVRSCGDSKSTELVQQYSLNRSCELSRSEHQVKSKGPNHVKVAHEDDISPDDF